MNFLNFLTSGAGIFNFNLQNLSLNNSSNSLTRNFTLATGQSSEPSGPSDEKKTEIPCQEGSDSSQVMERMLTTSQTELLTHQQQLINQYMHLNIQLLSKKIQCLEHQPQKKQESQQIEIKSSKKKMYLFLLKSKKQNVNCGHNDRQHYAKGMCNNCYHKNGRTKKPWKCSHDKLYANGYCQNCYINMYNKMKREKSSNSDIMEEFQSKQLNSQLKVENSQ